MWNPRNLSQTQVEQPPILIKAGKQDDFHKDRYEVFARLISAGTGSGKTRAGAQEAWLWTHECPGSVGLLLAPTFGMIKRNLVPTIEKVIGDKLTRHPYVENYNRSEGKITWQNGSVWWLLSLNEPERVEGINADWEWADEFRLVGGSGPSSKKKQVVAWDTLIRRLRGSKPGRYPTGVWVTTTPDEPGSLLHTKFENPHLRIPSSKVYRWTIFDNPFLPRHYIEEVKRSHVEGTGLYNRFVLGLFASVAAGTFNFDSTIHCYQKHIPRDYFHEIVYGVDWGWSNPACILAIGLDGDNRAWILEEFYKSRAPLEEIAKIALEMQKRWGEGRFYCDRSEPRSIEYLCQEGLEASADKTKRDDGIRELGSRFPVQEDNRARIMIHEDCVNLIAELQVYDENVKQYDHAVDALRYGLANANDIGGNIEIGFGPRMSR